MSPARPLGISCWVWVFGTLLALACLAAETIHGDLL